MNQDQEVKKPLFTQEQLVAAVQKRWRSDITKNNLAVDLMNQDTARKRPFFGSFTDDGETTLEMAMTRVFDMLKYHFGNKDYVQTAEEQKQNILRSHAFGLAHAFLNQLKKPTKVLQLRSIGRQVTGLRKLDIQGDMIADKFLQALKDEKIVYLVNLGTVVGSQHRDAEFQIINSRLAFQRAMSDEEIIKVMKRCSGYFHDLS